MVKELGRFNMGSTVILLLGSGAAELDSGLAAEAAVRVGQTLGRLATQIATWLRGKHLPTFAEHMDLGDFVVVVNASRIRVTGNKAAQRKYYRHSTYPGGLKVVALGDLLEKHPERVIKHTVRGMLPHNALGRKMLRKLKIYSGATHPHSAQQPKNLEI